VKVTTVLRKGACREKAESAGLAVKEVAEAVKDADIVMILLPDVNHAQVYAEAIGPNMKQGAAPRCAGFNIHMGSSSRAPISTSS
jgi:ketol-acid reductoisomerase